MTGVLRLMCHEVIYKIGLLSVDSLPCHFVSIFIALFSSCLELFLCSFPLLWLMVSKIKKLLQYCFDQVLMVRLRVHSEKFDQL